MPTVKIMQIDEDVQEAIVETEISLDESVPAARISLIVFGSPMVSSEMNRELSLFAFLVTDIVSENGLQVPEKTNCGYFSYRLFAKVADAQNRIVQLGDIEIVLDCPIPKDVFSGSYISFDVMRLDLPM